MTTLLKIRTLVIFTACTVMSALGMVSTVSAEAIANEEPYFFEPREGNGVEAYRGSFEVPENRQDPDTRMITLHYLRFPSTNPNPGSPIVYLAGGPGGSGVGTARGRRFPLFMALREVADVIAFDQRGTGFSNDLPNCETDITFPLTEPASLNKALVVYQQAADYCVDFWAQAGFDLKGYNTLESAYDLDVLREHLGADKLNLWSISYGTHLAMAAVKIMDNRLDRIVMTGAEGLHQTVKQPARTDEFFGRVQEAINKDPAAKAIYPDIAELMRRVQAKLEAEPARIEVDGPDGTKINFSFGKTDIQLLTAFSISDPGRTASVLGAYLALDAGQYQPIGTALFANLRSGAIELSPMSTAMDVASGISPEYLEMVDRQAETALVGSLLNFPMPHLRNAFGNLDLGEEFRSLPTSSTPTLLLSGTLDGRTYPESQTEAVAGFSDLTQVMVENAGHNLFMSSPEVGKRIGDFLKGEEVSAEPIVLPLPDFKPRQ